MHTGGLGVRGDLCVFVMAVVGMAGGMVSGTRIAFEGNSSSDSGGGVALRTMSYNIRVDTALDLGNRWSRRRQEVCDIIRDYGPDIVGLQEALKRQVDDIMQTLDGYRMIGVGRSDGRTRGEYSCILYRADRLDVRDSGTFWFSNTPEVPGSRSWGNMWTRICTWGHFVDRATGAAFYMYNVHMDAISQRSRENSARLLASRIRGRRHGYPYIVTGDFNARETNPAMRFLTARGPIGGERSPVSLVDAFRMIFPFTPGASTVPGARNKRIDYILTEPGVQVLAADIVQPYHSGRRASDHFPVTATLMIN